MVFSHGNARRLLHYPNLKKNEPHSILVQMNTITKRTAHLYLKFFAQCCLEMESVSQNNPKIKREKNGTDI